MVSIQDSIENCSICRNSRNKHFLMAPHTYNHIFGYIGPASKYNLCELLKAKDNISSFKKYKKHLKKSPSKLSNIFYTKNLDLKKENSQKWIQPGTFLYNVKSLKHDSTKMRYDESDTDFEDLKNPRPRSTTISQKNKNKANCKAVNSKMKSKSKSKIKGGNSRKKFESNVSHDSDNTHGKYSSTAVYCLSKDSILQNKSKRKTHRTDSEDMHPAKLIKNNNCKKVKNAIKNKLPVIDSDYSIDSTRQINRKNRNIRNTSTSSMKMKNLKSTLNNMFGSIESIKNTKHKRRHYNVSKPIDPEDIDPRIIRGCIDSKTKKTAAAFTNSDFSLNSRDDCNNKKKKKKVAKKKASDSSTDLNMKAKLKHGCFGSIESTKYLRKGKRKPTAVDIEDEMFSKYPCPQMSRKKSTKGRAPSLKKKKKKIVSKCYICMDLLKQHIDNKH